MPRKPNYGYDYDDDDADEFDEYQDYNCLQKGEAAAVTQEAVKLGVWHCSICTYDNDENMTSCEICGVLRFPSTNTGSNIDKEAVAGGGDKDYGVSKLAKALFAPVPSQAPKRAVASQPQTFVNVTGGGNGYHSSESSQRLCHLFSCGRSAPSSRPHTTIAPFKFDVPSPDDIISNRLNSSKKGGSVAPPGFAVKNDSTPTESSVRQTDVNIASTGRTVPLEENSFSSTSDVFRNIDVVDGPPSSERSDTFSTRKPKSNNNMAESSSFAREENPESVSSGLEDMSLNSKPGSSKPILPKKSLAQYKPEKWMLPEKQSSLMTQLNLAIVGHVDSGKSTLSGRLLHLLGQISQKQMHKFEKEAKQHVINKALFL